MAKKGNWAQIAKAKLKVYTAKRRQEKAHKAMKEAVARENLKTKKTESVEKRLGNAAITEKEINRLRGKR